MDEIAQPRKSVSSKLLLTVFLLIGLVIIVVAVRTYEARLAAANEAREAEYAAEYAAYEEANPVEETGDPAVAEEVVPAE